MRRRTRRSISTKTLVPNTTLFRSPEPDALPLLITHGWPGSVIEFHKVIAPLTNPAAYGSNPREAFHVIAPSIPGYGFADAPTGTGWGVERIAQTWIALIRRLGYDRFVAQGDRKSTRLNSSH